MADVPRARPAPSQDPSAAATARGGAPLSPTAPSRSMRSRPLLHFGQGLLMGIADVVPGVSGGTMALIVGIYERLVRAVREALALPVVAVRGWTAARAQLAAVEWGLVLPLGLGIVTAIVAASRVIPALLVAYPAESRGVFFGLIAASVVIPGRRMGRAGAREALVIAAAAALAFGLTGLPALEPARDPSLLRVFATAAVAICAMILPGVSGAFLLLVLGIYQPTLEAIAARDLVYVGVFALGALVGLGLFARVLTWLLERHHDLTMAALIGLMVGSLRALWPWLSEDRRILWPEPDGSSLAVLALAALGAALVLGLTWLGERRAAPRGARA